MRALHLSVGVIVLLAAGAAAQEPSEITGQAILVHPAGQAVLAAGKLLKAGKLAEVKQGSVRETRDEWSSMSAADKRADVERARERAPDPQMLAAEIARAGVLTLYGDTGGLRADAADGNTSIMAFVALEDGKWRVTGGPTNIQTGPVEETAPALVGAEILDHEIGKLVLAFAQRVEAGNIDAAMEMATAAARAKRNVSPQEREESDRYRRTTLPGAAKLAEQIRAGGRVTFAGEQAYLAIVTNTQTQNADGSVTSVSDSLMMPLALENGVWRIAD